MAEPRAPAAVLLLGAGSSSRMRGADKLLQQVDGEPVLRRQARAAQAATPLVLVALPAADTARRAALDGLGVTCVAVPDAAEGMAASIRAGVGALPRETPGVAILPADMPDITADDLATVLAAFAADPDRILRGAASDGRAGHPVVFPARLFGRLMALGGDAGAREVLRAEEVRLCPLPAEHALTDLDTPEDWAAWRAARQARR